MVDETFKAIAVKEIVGPVEVRTGDGNTSPPLRILTPEVGNGLSISHSGERDGSRYALSVSDTNASNTRATINLNNDGSGPALKIDQAQDVEVIGFNGCTDAGTAHSTIASSLKVKMPNGATGYINFYT